MTTPQGIRTLVDALDTQLSNQHANIVDKLDAILVALGSTPTTPTITLENIDTRLLSITTLLNSDLATISQQLQQIYDLLANSIAPNLENVFYAINDLYALQASAGNPKIPLPISTINLPSGAELLHCQRVQWMIDYFFNEWMQDVATTASGVQGASVGIGLGVLVAGTGTAAAIPIAIFSSGIAALLAAQSQGLQGLKTQATTAKRAALRQALYAAQNASAAQAAWNATIDGFSDVNIGYRTAWKVLIWSNWFNDLYDATGQNSTTVPGKWDLDGYDGSVCAPVLMDCQTSDSQVSHSTGGFVGTFNALAVLPVGMTWLNSVTSTSGEVTNIPPTWILGDLFGYRIRVISGTVRVAWRITPPTEGVLVNATTTQNSFDGVRTIDFHTNHWTLDDAASYGAFSVEICPPL
jgi:hypothetical protein